MTNQHVTQDDEQPDADLDPLSQSERELDMAINELKGETASQLGGPGKEPTSGSGDEARAPATPMRRETDNSVIMSIPVSVDVVLGTTEMPVHQLMALKKGTTVTLDRRISEPVDVVVSGRRIARGEIVVLEDDPTRFGIKLTEVVEN